ncbi:MAG TPA: hypothetical protein VKA70_09245 [Blastocatellia bacterium]|nr:hypothetical protein [Blastocatellia bacterium]
MSSSGNEGFVDLKLITVNNKPVVDSNLRLKVIALRPGNQEKEIFSDTVSYPLSQPMRLPAFPTERHLNIVVRPTRFKEAETGFFTLTSSPAVEKKIQLFRKPDQWRADFVAFDELPGEFAPLKNVLKQSPNLKVRGGAKLGVFAGQTYDNVTDSKATLAKLGLLNLCVKMSSMTEPVGKTGNWFSFVEEILEIAQSRVIALVRPEMGDLVRTIRGDFNKFNEYKNTPSGNHHGNMPAQFGVKKNAMFSIKSKDEDGNVQLTFGPGADAEGNPVMVLDADIDESGKLLAHIGDVFRHKITGQQTHPFDIHEYLTVLLPNTPLGYDLVEA